MGRNIKSFSSIWGVHGIYKEIAPYYAGSTKPKRFSGRPGALAKPLDEIIAPRDDLIGFLGIER
jgi:hypothetical protein